MHTREVHFSRREKNYVTRRLSTFYLNIQYGVAFSNPKIVWICRRDVFNFIFLVDEMSCRRSYGVQFNLAAENEID